MTTATAPLLPGRLGTSDLQLGDDPRADPRMIAALTPLGLAGAPEPIPVDADSPIEALLEFCAIAESGYEELFAAIFAGMAPVAGVTSHTEVITGPDGNEINLYVHRPADATGPLPGVLHLHGGGMVILTAAGASYARWRDELAATGMVVVGVEFRNGGGSLGPNPFPAGLDDCNTALRWVAEHRADLGIDRLIVSGESGGGNLSLATTIRAKREGIVDEIAGVYAQCPYISGAYAVKDPALASLYENDGYFLDVGMLGVLACVYDPDQQHTTDPLAWPLHATVDELAGLPPHVISVNQLDPLRDEGLAYFTKLLAAGVEAVSRTVNGTIHAGDCILAEAMPDVYAATLRDIKGFADSL